MPGMARVEEICSAHLLPPVSGGRAGLGAMRMEELALLFTMYGNLESKPCILSGLNSKVDPGGMSMRESDLRV